MKPAWICTFALAALGLGTWLAIHFRFSSGHGRAQLFGYILWIIALISMFRTLVLTKWHWAKAYRLVSSVAVVAWLVASFVPLFPHAALAPWGFDSHFHSFWELSHVH